MAGGSKKLGMGGYFEKVGTFYEGEGIKLSLLWLAVKLNQADHGCISVCPREALLSEDGAPPMRGASITVQLAVGSWVNGGNLIFSLC